MDIENRERNERMNKYNFEIGYKGFDILGVLCIIFVILKITNVIQWSWWLVLMPLWANIILFIIGLCILFIIQKR